MRRVLLVLILLAWAGGSAFTMAPQTFETITVTNASIGLTATTLNPAGGPQHNKCVGRVETNAIRVRWDGTAPTASVGMIVYADETITLTDHATASRFRMIRVSADATVTFACFVE
jgi:hypothetical protein